jgi:hypothetical protein
VHGRHSAFTQAVEQLVHETPSEPSALRLRQEVDVQMRGITVDVGEQHPLGVVNGCHELGVGLSHRVWPHTRPPDAAEPFGEGSRVGGRQHVSDDAAAVVDDERQRRIVAGIGRGIDIREQGG